MREKVIFEVKNTSNTLAPAEDLNIFLILLFLASSFISYKIISTIIDIYNYKKGFKIEGKVSFLEWVKSPQTKFEYLYPKEQLKISYKIELDGKMYEKTENDIHFRYKKIEFKYLPKVGDKINVHIPKNKKLKKITINQVNKTFLPTILLSILLVICLFIILLILMNN